MANNKMDTELIYKSRFNKIYFDTEKNEIFYLWLKSSVRLNDKKLVLAQTC